VGSEMCIRDRFWIADRKDHAEAWRRYHKLCTLGGSKSFLELVKAAGLANPFDQGTLAPVVAAIKTYLDDFDQSKLV